MHEYQVELAKYQGSVLKKLAAETKTIQDAQTRKKALEDQLAETRAKLLSAKQRMADLDEQEDVYADKMLPPTPAWLWAKAAMQAKRAASREFLELLAEHRQRVESSASSSSLSTETLAGASRASKRPQPPGLVTAASRSSHQDHPEKKTKMAAPSDSR